MKTFDVAISFAGEDRPIAQRLAQILKSYDLVVFYDDDAQAELLGENLTEYLIDIYKNRASYCLILVSEHYVRKRWARHEWKAAQARAFEEFDRAYILPVRLDHTELPGLLSTIGYISLKSTTIEKVASLVHEKASGVAEVNRMIRLADAAFRAGEFKKVVDLLSERRIYDRLLNDRVGLRLLADSYMTLGSYEEAVGVLEHVVLTFPDDAESHFLLGVCYYRLKDYDKAIKSYERALKLAPHHHTAYTDLQSARRKARSQRNSI